MNQIRCEPPRLVYFLAGSRRPRSFDQRGYGNGTDVQIGGGVRVGDAFQAIVGFQSVAIRITGGVCRSFSGRGFHASSAQARAGSTKSRQREAGTGKSSESRPRAGGSLDGLNELA